MPVPGTFGSFVNDVNPGANDSGAQVVPPSVEYEIPQPSLKCQSFHIPMRNWPFGLIPSESSFAANWSSVTRTGDETVAAPAAEISSSAEHATATSSASLIDILPPSRLWRRNPTPRAELDVEADVEDVAVLDHVGLRLETLLAGAGRLGVAAGCHEI